MLLSTPVLHTLTHPPKFPMSLFCFPGPMSAPAGVTEGRFPFHFSLLQSLMALNPSRKLCVWGGGGEMLQHPGNQAEVGSSCTHSGSADP